MKKGIFFTLIILLVVSSGFFFYLNGQTRPYSKPIKSSAAPVRDATEHPGSFKNFTTYRSLSDFWMTYLDSLDQLKKLAEQKLQSGLHRHDSLESVIAAYYNAVDRSNEEFYLFLESHPKTAANFSGVLRMTKALGTDIVRTDALFSSFPPELQHSAQGSMIRKFIDEKLKLKRDRNYNADILQTPLQDLSGRQVKLIDLTADYLLLDFWAAYCIPCRYENRELEKRNSLIEKNGRVKIISFSMDENPLKWRKAYEADQLTCLTVSDLKGAEGSIVKEFGIKEIPQNVLIDRKGNIIARNLWKDSLVQFIRTLN